MPVGLVDVDVETQAVAAARRERRVVEVVVRLVAQEVVDAERQREVVVPALHELERVQVVGRVVDAHDALLGMLRRAVLVVMDIGQPTPAQNGRPAVVRAGRAAVFDVVVERVRSGRHELVGRLVGIVLIGVAVGQFCTPARTPSALDGGLAARDAHLPQVRVGEMCTIGQ